MYSKEIEKKFNQTTIEIRDATDGELLTKFNLSYSDLFYWHTFIKQEPFITNGITQFIARLTDWENRLLAEDRSLLKLTELYQIGIIRGALLKAKGNKSKAARILNIGRTTLIDMCNRYNLVKDCEAATESEPIIDKAMIKIDELNEDELSLSIEKAQQLLHELEAQVERLGKKPPPLKRVVNG